MSQIAVNVAGTWHSANPYVRVSGSWQPVQSGWVRVSGVWQKFYQNSSVLFSGTLTAGHYDDGFSHTDTGYDALDILGSGGPVGSISPTTDSNGHTIQVVNDLKTSTTYAGVSISGFGADPGVSYFSSIVANSQTRTTASATYTYSSGTGIAQWHWLGSGNYFGFVGGNNYSVVINQ